MNTTATDHRRRVTAHAASASRGERTTWWLWPHLWSLDAPLVAVAWQHWWAHAARVDLPLTRDVILGGAVWLIYLADRLADVTRAGQSVSTDYGTARHAFHTRTRATTARLVLAVTVALAVLAPALLSAGEFGAGLGMLGLAGTYFWLMHRRAKPGWTAIFPKEAAVGGLFALGSALFVACRCERVSGTALAAWIGGAVLFALNCALISRWEACAGDRRDPASLRNAFPGTTARLGGVCMGLMVTAAAFSLLARSEACLPVAVGAGCLALLDRSRNRLSADALRVLADVVLLTPWCLLAVLGRI